MRPMYVQLAHVHNYFGSDYETMVKFAGQPLDVVAMMKTNIPFIFTRLIQGQSNDFIEIDNPVLCDCL